MPPEFWYRYWRTIYVLTGLPEAFQLMLRCVRIDQPDLPEFLFEDMV